jgi:hypothetical protein
MAYNGSGTFSRLYNWVVDRDASVPITASRVDAEMDGFATGLTTAITKDGQTTTSARIPFAVGVGMSDGTVGTPAINFTADTDSGVYRIGANNIGVAVNGAKVLDVATTGLSVTGTMSSSGVTYAADGTVLLPGVAFTADTDSGVYRIGANNIGVAVNGAKVLDVATTGLSVAGTLSSTSTVTSGPVTVAGAGPQFIGGANASVLGSVKLFGSTSGDATIQPAAVAGAATAVTLPAVSGTLATLAGTETLTNKTLTAPTITTMTYAGTTLSNAVTGTGAMVLATSPTLTTPVLGVATATSVNKVAITAPATSATLTIADGKTATINNTLTLVGTDNTTMTFPATTGTVATLGLANTWALSQTFSSAIVYGGVTLSNAVTGTGNMVLATSPTLTTPVLGVATGTSWNGLTITTTTGTLTVTNGKTLSVSNTLTLAGTDSTTMTFPATSGTVGVLNNAGTWTAVQGYAPAVLTFSATQTWDVSTNPIATLAMTASITSFSISNAVAGRYYTLKVTQDSTPRTIAYTAANFKFVGGSAPTLSIGSGAIDYYTFIALSSTVLHEVGRAQAVA